MNKATYRIVELTELGWIESIVGCIEAFEIRGYELNGFHSSPHTRAELQGQPTFKGLVGPMWDRDAIRYENREANNRLSA